MNAERRVARRWSAASGVRAFGPLLVAAVTATAGPTTLAGQTDSGLVRLEREIERLAQLAGGLVGVGARHLETGREIYLRADEPFPMASTFKVPVAVQLFTRLERGEVRLDTMIALRPEDLHPGSGTLTSLFDDPGVVLSLHNLVELMLLISDNSATDIVLGVAGGPAAVTQRMRSLGLPDIRVDRPTINLIADWAGVTSGPLDAAAFEDIADALPDTVREDAARAFDRDPRDTATPRAMTTLLARLWRGEILDSARTAMLLDIMQRSTTGARRLRGLLTPDVMVAHKTGTIGGTTNDVGIITLPDDAGHVAVSVFVKASTRDVAQREEAIAHIARAIFDYFTFSPRAPLP